MFILLCPFQSIFFPFSLLSHSSFNTLLSCPSHLQLCSFISIFVFHYSFLLPFSTANHIHIHSFFTLLPRIFLRPPFPPFFFRIYFCHYWGTSFVFSFITSCWNWPLYCPCVSPLSLHFTLKICIYPFIFCHNYHLFLSSWRSVHLKS
mgnify:CR=1 FL=1